MAALVYATNRPAAEFGSVVRDRRIVSLPAEFAIPITQALGRYANNFEPAFYKY